ncbi:MAG: hypothetical protein VB100_01350 [Angelakisella sp.]|nr:hypothetical protein [Angelakisella sp.]
MNIPDERLIQQYKEEMFKLRKRSEQVSASMLLAPKQSPVSQSVQNSPREGIYSQSVNLTATSKTKLKASENNDSTDTVPGTEQPVKTVPGTEQPAETVPSPEQGIGYFKAQVFTGNQALPVKGANVVLKKDGKIIAFLTTDESGQTKIIETEAPAKQNALDPNSPKKTEQYFADVWASGFTKRTNLLVEQAGGELSLLIVDLIPEPEGVM